MFLSTERSFLTCNASSTSASPFTSKSPPTLVSSPEVARSVFPSEENEPSDTDPSGCFIFAVLNAPNVAENGEASSVFLRKNLESSSPIFSDTNDAIEAVVATAVSEIHSIAVSAEETVSVTMWSIYASVPDFWKVSLSKGSKT